jgi:large subunit ribosomal protein L2
MKSKNWKINWIIKASISTKAGEAQEIKRYDPVTPSRRQKVLIRALNLYKGKPEKKLVIGKLSTGGRNSDGRITCYHRGGGHKRNYRIIDFHRDMGAYSEAIVIRLEYDPNRSANIALCQVINSIEKQEKQERQENSINSIGTWGERLQNKKFYILAPKGLKPGDKIYGKYSPLANLALGQTKPLKELPIGSIVNNLAAIYARSAGTQAIVLKHKENTTLLRLPSKEIKEFSHNELATIGSVSNPWHNNRNLGKAGASAWIGRLPRVKGVKMNPIDHPHGGKTPVSGGLGSPARNRWGRLAKWQKHKFTHTKIKNL